MANKSISGKASIIKAMAIFAPVKMASDASIKPAKILPPSPKKILAGYLFNNKNPKKLPHKIKESVAIVGSLNCEMVVKRKMLKAPKTAMPETNPSNPSSNFVE